MYARVNSMRQCLHVLPIQDVGASHTKCLENFASFFPCRDEMRLSPLLMQMLSVRYYRMYSSISSCICEQSYFVFTIRLHVNGEEFQGDLSDVGVIDYEECFYSADALTD